MCPEEDSLRTVLRTYFRGTDLDIRSSPSVLTEPIS
jgi:hypothetical protein